MFIQYVSTIKMNALTHYISNHTIADPLLITQHVLVETSTFSQMPDLHQSSLTTDKMADTIVDVFPETVD